MVLQASHSLEEILDSNSHNWLGLAVFDNNHSTARMVFLFDFFLYSTIKHIIVNLSNF